MVDALLGADLADVNHALDALAKLHKRAELGEARDRPFDHRADRESLPNFSPWITQRLLQAERNAAFAGVHSENHHFHRLAWLHHVARLLRLFRPRHL